MNNSSSLLIDPTALDQYREVMGDEGDEFIVEIVQTFLDGADNMTDNIFAKFKAGAIEDFHIGVHSMKSNLKLLGANNPADKFADLEKLSSLDLSQINVGMVQTAIKEVMLVCNELGKIYPDTIRKEK